MFPWLRKAVCALTPHPPHSKTLARTRKVVTPVIDEVYAMLYEGKDVRQAVHDLTARESKAED